MKSRLSDISDLLENFSPILKQGAKSNFDVFDAIEPAVKMNWQRFKFHEILFVGLEESEKHFRVKCPKHLLVSVISNLIDNAIYWLDVQKAKTGENGILTITIDRENFAGPTLVITDNGPGFAIAPTELVPPFKTLKPDGMGVGLYFSSLVMDSIGGTLHFPKLEKGAAIALTFPQI